MKRNFLIVSVSFVALAALFFIGSTASAERSSPTEMLSAPPACPTGTVTVQGCIFEVDNCFYVNTTNGRTISINLSGQSVGAGDNASLTGQFVGDQDCNPCTLNVTSSTDLGDC